jgi:hypothetical protein
MQHPAAKRAGKKAPGSKKPITLAKVIPGRTSGSNRPTLWARDFDDTPLRLLPAEQAMALVDLEGLPTIAVQDAAWREAMARFPPLSEQSIEEWSGDLESL